MLHFYEQELAASSVSSRGITQVRQHYGTFEDIWAKRFYALWAIPLIFLTYKLKGLLQGECNLKEPSDR